MIEAMTVVAGEAAPLMPRRSGVGEPLATVRTCYDHLAGRLAVALADVLQDREDIVFADGSGEVTARGQAFFAGFGLDLERKSAARRVFCRPCLDWTERRHHLAGAVGAALCAHCVTHGWLQRTRDSRAMTITPAGQTAFAEIFGIDAASLGRSMDRAA